MELLWDKISPSVEETDTEMSVPGIESSTHYGVLLSTLGLTTAVRRRACVLVEAR
jgi:hypothetical protein